MTPTHPLAMHVLAPLHGMLAAFPLALFATALVSDIAYASSANPQWANFSAWLIVGGLAVAVFAAILGGLDALIARSDMRRRSAVHGVLTIAFMVTALINAFIHSRDGWTAIVPTGLILSIVTVVLVLVASWLGYAASASVRERRI